MRKDTETEFDDEPTTAARMGIGASTLQQARYRGEGPPFVRIGKLVRYRRRDVEAWLVARTVGAVGGAK
jgi:predicted DNA-binding transcriptional regulator AlpA